MTRYTTEDLVRYLYQQTSLAENIDIKAALDLDWALNEKFKVLKSSVNILDGALESPRIEVVLSILDYARKTMVAPV